jgi:DNA-binding CsgD family transcriptional regulator
VRAVDGDNDAVGVAAALDPVHFMARGFLRYAQAVVAGRAGDPDRAAALVADGDRDLANLEWYRQLGRRLVSEAAVADGWGQPVAWLREALAFFDRRGDERLASACRSLLRRAGVAVPRRRSGAGVPAPLRALGVTDREAEVLALLAEGLANQEIATRLFLSPRTVERHIANLSVKVGVERRAQLVAYAARVAAGTP